MRIAVVTRREEWYAQGGHGSPAFVSGRRQAMKRHHVAALAMALTFCVWFSGVIRIPAPKGGLFLGVIPAGSHQDSVIRGTIEMTCPAIGGILKLDDGKNVKFLDIVGSKFLIDKVVWVCVTNETKIY